MTTVPISGAAPKVTYDTSNVFQRGLRARVDRYFRMTRRSPRDCPRMYLKTAIIILWFAASYALLVFGASYWWQAVPLAVSLGLAMAAIGFNVQHDGGHKAYSRHTWVNRFMATWMDLMGASSFIWSRKHNTLHHTYTNLAGHDEDIDVGFLARLSPHQTRYGMHRLQHFYMWVLYAFISMKWVFYDDFRDLALGKIGTHRFKRPRGADLALLVGGKAFYFFFAFVLPALLHPLGIVLLFYALASAAQGIVLAVVFQLAHVVEKASFPQPDPETGRVPRSFAVHQLETTVDFARANRAVSWFVGGLNFQVEHHLFPRICHIHYPKISRIVENACRKAGIRYHAYPTVFAAIRSHYRQLKALGRPGNAAGAA